jgi:tetratricopeptide (TPR) repeat protein
MELVKGIPITKYCDEHHVEPRQRLELFMQVCQAVQHAHQKGIIHRDLKPSNVLVAQYDGKPVPKVIDFGVAKATGQSLTDLTMFTGFGDVIGTLEYMSPEQAEVNQLDVDTRSDIYSLGVLLYELLTGTTPLEHERVRKAGLLEMLKIVREEEPPKPSMRLSTTEQLPSISANRGLEPKKLSGLVKGELDWIVMKALEKDRARRYETANGFATDVRRYLDDEAVQACPPSASYRLRKFTRRNKAALLMVSLAVAGLLTLVVGLAVSNHLIVAERNQKTRALALAEAQRTHAQANLWRANIAIRELMTKTAIGNDDVPLAVRKRFSDEAVKYYQALIQDSPSDQISRYETAVGYQRLGLLHLNWKEVGSAEKCYRKSIAIFEGLLAEDPGNQKYREQLGFAWLGIGDMLRIGGRLEEGLVASTRGEEIYEKLLRETPNSFDYAYGVALSMRHLSTVQIGMEKYQDAKSSCSRAVELLTNLVAGRFGPDTYPTERSQDALWVEMSSSKEQMGFGFRHAKQNDEAAIAFQQAVGLLEKARDFDPQKAYFLYRLGEIHRQIGLVEIDRNRLDKAEQELRRSVEIYQQCIQKFPEETPSHPEWAECYGDLSRLLVSTGRAQEAQALMAALRADQAARLTKALDHNINVLEVRIQLAHILFDGSKLDEAMANFTDAVKLAPAATPELKLALADVGSQLAEALRDKQKPEKAERAFRQAISLRQPLADAPPAIRQAQANDYHHMAFVLTPASRWHEAEDDIRTALRLKQTLVDEFPDNDAYRMHLADSHIGLGIIACAAGRTSDTMQALGEAAAILNKVAAETAGTEDIEVWVGHASWQMGDVWLQLGRFGDAEQAYQKALETFEKLTAEHPTAAFYRQEQGFTYRKLFNVAQHAGRMEDAERHLLASFELYKKLFIDNPQSSFYRQEAAFTARALTDLLLRTRKYEQAESLLLAEYADLQAQPTPQTAQWRDLLDRITGLYRSWGKSRKLAEWDAKSLAAVTQALTRAPKDIGLQILRGHLLRDTGELQQALAQFSAVLAVAPQQSDAWTGRGFAYFHLEQWEKAIADFSKAIELGPPVHANWFHRGLSYIQLAQWDKAAADFTKVIEGWPHDPGGWFFRGCAYAQLNQPEKAINDLRQAITEGFKDIEHLKSEPKLEPLRSNEEFKRLLAAMEEKQK